LWTWCISDWGCRQRELAAVAGFCSGDLDVAAVHDMRERRYPQADTMQELTAFLHRARAAPGALSLQVRSCCARHQGLSKPL